MQDGGERVRTPDATGQPHVPCALILGGQCRGDAAVAIPELEEAAGDALLHVEPSSVDRGVGEHNGVALSADLIRGDRAGALGDESGLGQQRPKPCE